MHKLTFYLGGITCSGKTTVAGLLAERCGLTHYKTDDTFDRHAKAADRDREPTLWTYQYDEATWTGWFMRLRGGRRARILQRLYGERFDMIAQDVSRIEGPVILDGVDLLPEKVQPVAETLQAAWLIPSRDFVNRHYTEREWADNPPDDDGWEYYTYFVENIREQSRRHGLKVIEVDGTVSAEEVADLLAAHYGLRVEPVSTIAEVAS